MQVDARRTARVSRFSEQWNQNPRRFGYLFVFFFFVIAFTRCIVKRLRLLSGALCCCCWDPPLSAKPCMSRYMYLYDILRSVTGRRLHLHAVNSRMKPPDKTDETLSRRRINVSLTICLWFSTVNGHIVIVDRMSTTTDVSLVGKMRVSTRYTTSVL